ncbi:DUF3883 domain-containing protein [Streptomyces sp. NBC_01471]|uniref:protein NO VEIN domain-containing protein n=1 Tax=Streptomyces sp. NBC_01471 TaxID=2903879 RepID=UPI003253E022
MDPESAFQIFLDAAERMRPGRVEAALAEVLAAGQVFGLGGDNPEAAVMTVSGKIDLERRVRTGEAGEAGLLQMLRQGGWSARQVSLEADGFGYDIAATDVAGGELHLEVKSTTAIRGYVVHLSRHEFHIMCADPSWRMIAVRLDGHDQVQDVATVSREWIAQAVPMDRDGGGRWESVRLVIPDCEVVPGISGLGPPGTCCDGARDLVGLLGS